MATFTFPSEPPARSLPADPIFRADIEHVRKHGYVVLDSIFSKAEAEEAKAEIKRMSGSAPMAGRNAFEGLDTNRIYSLLNKTRVFDKFCTLPRVLGLNDYFLDEGYMVSAIHSIQINPGEKAQQLHHDDGYCQLARPRPPLATAILLAFDDFTVENGATRIIPGSHEWDSTRRPSQGAPTIPAVCPAGSVVYFIGTTWHGGGANESDRPRLSATVQYCQPYLRPIENQILAVDPRRLDEIPERLVNMMGYSTHKPFIGYADGLNPLRAAKRMVRWLQQPVDKDPPAFAQESQRESKL